MAAQSTYTEVFTLQLLDRQLALQQDNSTMSHATTVWPASVVLAKLFEKNRLKKNEFGQAKWEGKRAIELGSGMGLGGMALSLVLGMQDVTLTDVASTLPMLRRNSEANLGPGKVRVQELDWLQPEQLAAFTPPYDLLVATDCIFHEDMIPHFHRNVMALTSPHSTVVIVNELRSHTIQEAFQLTFSATHSMKRVPASKLHEEHQHPLMEVWVLRRKRARRTASAAAAGAQGEDSGSDDGGAME